MERRVRARLTKEEGRKFGIPVGLAFAALAGITWWRGHDTVAIIFASLAGLLIMAGLLIPTRLGPAYRGWMKLALAISKVTTPIFMGVVYFLVLTPTGVVLRLLGKNPLDRESEDDTYWVSRTEGGRPAASDMNRQF